MDYNLEHYISIQIILKRVSCPELASICWDGTSDSVEEWSFIDSESVTWKDEGWFKFRAFIVVLVLESEVYYLTSMIRLLISGFESSTSIKSICSYFELFL